ncbi:MAG TPA: hypothetical protein VGE04_00580 [Chloroflexia bacterium]
MPFTNPVREHAGSTQPSEVFVTDVSSQRPSRASVAAQWRQIVNSLHFQRELVMELQRMEARLYVSGFLVSLYVGDSELADRLVQECRAPIQEALRRVFTNEIRFVFEEELQILPLEVVARDQSSPGQIELLDEQDIEQRETIVLSATIRDIDNTGTAVSPGSISPSLADLLDLKGELEQVLETNPHDFNARLELIGICGQIGLNYSMGDLILDRSSFSPSDMSVPWPYMQALGHARTLYQVPTWKQSAKLALDKSVPYAVVMEIFLTEGGIFKLVRRLAEPMGVVTRHLHMEYKSGLHRERIGREVLVSLHEVDILESDDDQTLIQQFEDLEGPGSRILTIRGTLFRKHSDRAWLLMQTASKTKRQNENSTVISLEYDRVLDKMLESKRPDAELRNLIKHWVVPENLFGDIRVATGYKFYGRERDLFWVRDTLVQGTNIALVGLGRVGKTSLLCELRERHFLEDLVTQPIDCRVTRITSCGELGRVLTQSLLQDAARKYPNLAGDPHWDLDSIRLSTNKVGYSPDDFQQDILTLLERLPEDLKVIVVIDEVAVLLPKESTVRESTTGKEQWLEFLGVLRDLWESNSGRFVWVTLAKQPVSDEEYIQGHENPLRGRQHLKRLSVMDEEDCREMIVDMGFQMKVDFRHEDTLQAIVSHAGLNPGLTRELCSTVFDRNRERPLVVTAKMVHEAAAHMIGGSMTLRSLSDILSPQELAVLDIIAREDDLENNSKRVWSALRESEIDIVYSLRDLGLIDIDPDRIKWLLGLLRTERRMVQSL